MITLPIGDRVVMSIRSSAARLVALFSPSGFGKTQRVRAIGALADSHVYRPLDAGDDPAALLTEIREALEPVPMDAQIVVTLDDVERVEDATLALLIDAILDWPYPHLRLLVCGRREPSFTFVRYSDRVGTAIFRRAELGLGIDDRHVAAFAQSPISSDELTRTLCISNGWPEVTLYFVRLAREGRLNEAMRSFSSSEWRDLFDWVEEKVVAPLPDAVRHGLCLAAAVTDARSEDFAKIGDRVDVALFRDYQLADVGMSGEIRLLPLLRHYCFARHLTQMRVTATEFAERIREEDPLRAARALINTRQLGQAHALLADLEHIEVMALGDYAYPGTSLEIFAKAPPYLLHPRVWYGLITARRAIVGSAVLADEAEELLEARVFDARWELSLRAVAAILCFECARPLRARQHLATIQDSLGEDDRIRAFAQMVDDVFSGRYRKAVERWHEHGMSIVDAPAWFGWLGLYHASALDYLGEFGRVKRSIETLIALGQWTPALAVEVAVAGAFFSWTHRDREALAEYRSEAARLARYYDVPAYWVTIAGLYGITPSKAAPPLLSSVQGQMVLAAALPADEAKTVGEQAIARADDLRALSLRVLSRLLLAAIDEGHAMELCDRAFDLAQHAGSSYLVDMVSAMRLGRDGLLLDFAQRTAPLTGGTPVDAAPVPSPAVQLRTSDLSVVRAAEKVRVSERVRELLFFLGTSRSAVRREVVIDHVWPDLDGDSALSALKMCVHRARVQTGTNDVITVSSGTYALGPAAHCDYFDIMRHANTPYEFPLDVQVREHLKATFERLHDRGYAVADPWPWMLAVTRALNDAAISLGERLYRDARARGDAHEGLAIAREMTDIRPELELPRVLLVELLLETGNAPAARQAYDEYLRLCRERYGSEPTSSFRKLIAG